MDWDLLCTFATVARLGSLTAAAKQLGQSQSTISRKLSKLEESAESPLLLRETPVRLTERGSALLAAVLPMADAAISAQAALEDSPQLHGEVSITTVGEVARWLLAPALSDFYRDYPSLRLVLLVDNKVSSLAAGEADVALRMTRPVRGELVGRRLHLESYSYFASAELALHAEVPWLGLCGSLAQIPEQQHAARAFAARPPRLLVEDVEALGLAVAAGLGVALLPHVMAARLSGIVAVKPAQVGAHDLGPLPQREFWVVVHRSKQQVPKVRAVLDWLSKIEGLRDQRGTRRVWSDVESE